MEDDSEQSVFAFIKSLIRKKASLNNGNHLAEEIQDLMDEGKAKGLFSTEESEMVHGVLDLKDMSAYSIMIPRTEISSAPSDATLEQIIKLVTNCGHTRIPIYKANIDEIIGILHAKDLLRFLGEDPGTKIPAEILRKPYFISTTQNVSQLLRDLKANKTHIAIVTDEYGGTAGIITIEDILEEIVGDIMDEHDSDQPLLTVLDDGSLLVDARLGIEKLEEHLNLQLPKAEFESVGGFIIHLLGRIPTIDEKVSFEGLEIEIKDADQRRINQILIKSGAHPELFKKQNSSTATSSNQ